ncbi:MAG: conjugal transfer protein TraF, partial [Armatimonadota bacterium]
AYTAVADGPSAVYWNPAGLAKSHGFRTSFAVTGKATNLDVLSDGRDLYNSIGDVIDAINNDSSTIDEATFNRLWTSAQDINGRPVNAEVSAGLIGLSFGHVGVGVWAQAAAAAVLTESQSSAPTPTSWATANGRTLGYGTAGLGYGWSLNPTLDVGVSARYMVAAAADAKFRVHGDGSTFIIDDDNHYGNANDSNFGVDLGLIWSPQPEIYHGRVRLAAMLRNVNGPEFDLPAPVKFSPTLNLGLAVTSPDNKWLVALDVDNATDANDYSKQLCAGVEYSVNSWLDLRAGVYQGEVTKGIGINLGGMKLSAAIANDWKDLSSFGLDWDF